MNAMLVMRPREPVKGRFDMDPNSKDYEALGRFLMSCSSIEITMHRLIRRWLGIPDDTARFLIEEPRASRLSELVKFAFSKWDFDIRRDEVAQALTRICDECSELNKVRSIVAHKPCVTDGFCLRFHDSITAKVRSKAWTYECTAHQLAQASLYGLQLAFLLHEAGDIRSPDAQFFRQLSEPEASRKLYDLPPNPGASRQVPAKRAAKPAQ